ncbi:alpha-tocopherol transfer protein-like [Schistocerca gregaria]|uniref:alpha-tocopherol transfer protein-like n=1 Tax=Schistocerca gregaria TaxID=7010 RepID=UPI00211E41E5|nr:alpha-tocopherol transfer protein-like [Schistocerca gregaria]
MTLISLPPAVQQAMEKEMGRDRAGLTSDVANLRAWLRHQPHLPQDQSEEWLERFLIGCKYSVERAKTVLDMYYTVRGAVPEFFSDRDPLGADVLRSVSAVYYFPVPGYTPEGYRVSLSALADTDPSVFSPRDYMKRMFLVADVRLQEEPCLGEVLLFDLRGFTLQHLVKFTLPLAKKLLVCGQNALPTRIKQIHLLYAPSFADKILAIFKPYMKEKLAKRVYVHTGGSEGLAKFFSTDILPEEYGGSAGSRSELNLAWQKKLESYRDWILEEEKKRADESRRPGKTRLANELFGMEGSFKQLAID